MKSKTKIIFGGVLLLAVVMGGCYMSQNIVYSDGFRDGTLQKFGKKGLLYKTYEGELALQGMGGSTAGKTGQGGYGNVWSFTVMEDDVAEQLRGAAPGQAMRLHYKEYLWKFIGKTKYRVHEVEFIEGDAVAPPVVAPPVKK